MNRFATQVDHGNYDSNVHALLTIELSLGCSVGCPYCGADAGKLRRIARFTPENEARFRAVLRAMARFFVTGADRGFLYYATEPLDNPDYELYQQVFWEELGRVPQTTTAAWWRNPERTRRLLELSRAGNGRINRFSLNTQEQLRFCLHSFSAEELAEVDLIIHLPGSMMQLWAAGRGATAARPVEPGTAACVTGFRLNLPEGLVTLESPTADLRRWPEGRIIWARGHFAGDEELLAFMRGCQRDIMSFRPGDDFVPQWRPDWEHYRTQADEIGCRTANVKVAMGNHLARNLYRLIDGKRTVGDIVGALMGDCEPAVSYYSLNQWWKNGFFEEPGVIG